MNRPFKFKTTIVINFDNVFNYWKQVKILSDKGRVTIPYL